MLIRRREWVGDEEISGFGRPSSRRIGFDTETTGLDPWGTREVDRKWASARAFFFSFCDEDGNLSWARCPVDARTREVQLSSRVREAVETYLADSKLTKVIHNAPFDRRMVSAAGLVTRGRVECTMIGMHVIRPNEPTYRLKPLCVKYLNISADDEKNLKASVVSARRAAKKRGWAIDPEVAADYWLGDEDLLREYGLGDARRVIALRLAQEEHLRSSAGLREVFERELKLMTDIAAMEDAGVRIDEERLEELEAFYRKIITKHAKVIEREAAGLNLKSPKQMTEFWFVKRGATPVRYSKQKGGGIVACAHCKGSGCRVCQQTGQNPKCDGEFLETIGVCHETGEDGTDHLVPGDPLAWAMLHSQAASSMLGYLTQYREHAVREGNEGILVLHPNYKQVGARTARMSCERPNLQNVASDESGKKRVDVPYRSREVFIPRQTPPLYPRVLLTVHDELVIEVASADRKKTIWYNPDYSQIEVWILAILVYLKIGDQDLLNALARGGDAHQNVADEIWGDTYDAKQAKSDSRRAPEDLSDDERANLHRYKHARKRAKNLQFCKIYGGGVGKISSMIGCSIQEAKRFIEDYDVRLPAVSKFMDACVAEARAHGQVTNPFGRIYPIDGGFEYRATNYLVQGTAAEVMKNAIARVSALCRSGRWTKDCPQLRSAVVHEMQADWKLLKSPKPFPVGFAIVEERWTSKQDVEVDS